jgi:hypothetical protein
MSQAWKDHEAAMQEHWAKTSKLATLPTCLEGEVEVGDTVELADGQTAVVEGFDSALDDLVPCSNCSNPLEDPTDPDDSGLCDECFRVAEESEE